MAVTVDPFTNGDFVRLDRADAITNWSLSGSWSMIALDTTSKVENTGCIQGRVNAGVGVATVSFTSRSLENVHLRHWVKLAQSISSIATHGARLQIGTSANYGSYSVYGASKQVIVYNGWMMLVVDPRKPYIATAGTVPAVTAVAEAGSRVDFVDANGKDLVVCDMLWVGNNVSIEGGTTGARGTFTEWGDSDATNGYGILRNVGGVFYLNAGAVFQGTGVTTSYFQASNAVVIFEDLPVSGSLYKFRHAGNAVGTNHFQLGVSSGTGVDKEGSSGGVLRAAGNAPFRIEAIDANVNVVAYYGVTMLGTSAIYSDQARNIKRNDGGVFTGLTRAFTSATANDVSPFPTPAVNDAFYIGHDERFYQIRINTGTAKSGTYTILWEYWNGSAWVVLTDLTDGTNGFTTTGFQTITYAIPDGWVKQTTDGANRYWIRARISAFTSSTTVPLITQGTVGMIGDIRLERSAVEMIGCTLSGMGSIRVRNGAFLKKCTIGSSVAPAKHAAVDLGSADPAANTVRDLTIQNCSRGILLKGTSTGTTTYNFRNIQFAGNTFDVRLDFPTAATVIINVLEGGDSPTVDNVNGSARITNNAVTVSLAGATQGTAVKFIANETVGTKTKGDVLSQGFANSAGVYSFSFPYEVAFDPSGLDVKVVARNQGIASTAYSDNNGVTTVETEQASSNTTADMNLLVLLTGNQRYVIGHQETFTRLKLDVSTALVGTSSPAITWQYWNGASWANLSGVVDGTNSYQNLGESIISWTLPGSWATSSGLYLVRGALTSGILTVLPKGRKVQLDVSRYLPYSGDRVISATGLADTANWVRDTIANFSQ